MSLDADGQDVLNSLMEELRAYSDIAPISDHEGEAQIRAESPVYPVLTSGYEDTQDTMSIGHLYQSFKFPPKLEKIFGLRTRSQVCKRQAPIRVESKDGENGSVAII
jgi:hypothetical protein